MSRGQVSPRDKDLQHVPDDREGGDHAQLPVGEGHASIPEGATAQSEAQGAQLRGHGHWAAQESDRTGDV
jgi:hypothetical protein